MDMDISMDIHVKSVDMDMDMDVKIHIHGNPGESGDDDVTERMLCTETASGTVEVSTATALVRQRRLNTVPITTFLSFIW